MKDVKKEYATRFKLCLVGVIIRRMQNRGEKSKEKTSLLLVWFTKEKKGENLLVPTRRYFSPRSTKIQSLRFGEKTLEQCNRAIQIMTSFVVLLNRPLASNPQKKKNISFFSYRFASAITLSHPLFNIEHNYEKKKPVWCWKWNNLGLPLASKIRKLSI